MGKYKEVRVEWVDSCGGDCYWHTFDGFKPSITRPITYGFVIYEDEEIISIAQSYAEGDDYTPEQVNGIITIPKCSIVKMDEITLGSENNK